MIIEVVILVVVAVIGKEVVSQHIIKRSKVLVFLKVAKFVCHEPESHTLIFPLRCCPACYTRNASAGYEQIMTGSW